jgi:hypothetical protein
MIDIDHPMWHRKHCSFLTLAANFDLAKYIRMKLPHIPKDTLGDIGPYVLDCALRDSFLRPLWKVENRPTGDTVRTLLKHGVDVNHLVPSDLSIRVYQPLSQYMRTTKETPSESNTEASGSIQKTAVADNPASGFFTDSEDGYERDKLGSMEPYDDLGAIYSLRRSLGWKDVPR